MYPIHAAREAAAPEREVEESMSIDMACVAHGYRLQKNKEIEDAFENLANALEAIESRLTFNARFALRDAKNAAVHSGADGIRAHGEFLLSEVDKCPLKTAQVTEAARTLRDLLFK